MPNPVFALGLKPALGTADVVGVTVCPGLTGDDVNVGLPETVGVEAVELVEEEDVVVVEVVTDVVVAPVITKVLLRNEGAVSPGL